MAGLFILSTGLPGTGKSTTAKKIVENIGRSVFMDTPDSINGREYVENTYYGDNFFEADQDSCHIPLRRLGFNLIQSRIAPQRQIRERFYGLAKSFNSPVIVIYNKCPREIALNRLLAKKDKLIGQNDEVQAKIDQMYGHSIILYGKLSGSFEDPRGDLKSNPGITLYEYDTHSGILTPINVSEHEDVMHFDSGLEIVLKKPFVSRKPFLVIPDMIKKNPMWVEETNEYEKYIIDNWDD